MIRTFDVRIGAVLSVLGVILTLAGCKKVGGEAPPSPTSPAPRAAQSAAAPDTAGAKAFLEGLYAHYASSKNNSLRMFDADAPEVFDADTIRLLDQDTKALKGDLGAIDGDWLCECQDFESLKATVTVQLATPTTARAVADFTDTGMPGEGPRHNSFDLVRTAAGWRIHDIQEPGQPSLRQTLLDEIKSLAKGGKPVSSNPAP